MIKIKTLIFDVNETLLDLNPLKESINSALGDGAAEVWFAQLLHYSLVDTSTRTYHDFSELASAVFKMNAQKKNFEFSDSEIGEILSPITKLKAYRDVEPGLEKLKNSGFQLIAFSNGKPSVLKEQLDYAGLTSFFDKILSVELVKKYKPHPETYQYAVKEAGVEINKAMMVAAHGWDVTGASRAGMQTAFIQRPGKYTFPLAPKPTLETLNIETLANELIKV